MQTSAAKIIITTVLCVLCQTSIAASVTCSSGYSMDAVRAATAKISKNIDSLHPSPVIRVHTEGELPHQGIRDQSIKAEKDLRIMLVSAVAWHSGAGEAWLNTAQRYLLAWVNTYQPGFNPIDETPFDQLIQTYAMIKPTLSIQQRSAINSYLTRWAKEYIRQMNSAPNKGTWLNNWQSHRVKLVTLMALATDNDALFSDARQLFQKQVATNIDSSGETLDFRQRDALHYVVYDLQPLLQAALAAQKKGEDWYHWQAPTGASLAKGISWLTPYVNGEKTHNEFIHSTVKFDAIRKQHGIKGFTGLFEPQVARDLYWAAAQFDPSLKPIAQQLSATPPLFMAWCQ